MKITIMRDQLIAALCTAGKDDIRYYLNGVFVEASNMETRLTSTNGHIVSTQRADAKDENEVDGVVQMIIPRAALEKIKNHKVLRTVELNDEGGAWGIVDFDARTEFVPVDGKYPEYRRVIPATFSGEAAQFNPNYIALFAKAAKALGAMNGDAPRLAISHNGRTGNALVSIGRDDEYIGVIAPCKMEPTACRPEWAIAELASELAESVEDLL